MTKKQAFKSMDINGDGTLTKEELAEGLKKLGFHITDVGRILSVFDRDVSEGVDET
jgi:Ca2+-binding EF-hand superfamily protein